MYNWGKGMGHRGYECANRAKVGKEGWGPNGLVGTIKTKRVTTRE